MRRGWIKAALVGAACLAAAPVAAQSGRPAAADATTQATGGAVRSGDAAPAGEHLLGDWGGFRTDLADKGVTLSASYLSETAGVVSGGLRHGTAYADQLKLRADADLEQLIGWRGWSLHGTLLSRHGKSASADYLGDDLGAVQEIYGGTRHALVHLGQFYLENVQGDAVTVDTKVGRLPVGADFNTSPLYCGFLSLSICPQPRGQGINGAFSLDPSATWGARVKLGHGAVSLAGGAYQVRPYYGGPAGFDWGFSHSTGVILPVEAEWVPRFGADELQGHYKIGLTYDSSDRPDLALGRPGHGHDVAYYASVDQMLVRTGKNGTDGVILLGGWTHASPDRAIFRDFAFAGLVARGLLPARPADAIEAIVTHGWISHALTEAQRAALAAGETLPTGFPPAPGSFAGPAIAPGVQTGTTVYELNYAARVARGIILTPDVQYVVHPGAAITTANATVIGGRVEVDF